MTYPDKSEPKIKPVVVMVFAVYLMLRKIKAGLRDAVVSAVGTDRAVAVGVVFGLAVGFAILLVPLWLAVALEGPTWMTYGFGAVAGLVFGRVRRRQERAR